jgi:hypothetical protein
MSGTFAFAQSFKLLTAGTTTQAPASYTRIFSATDPNDDYFDIDAKNISSSTKTTKVKMYIISTPSGCSNDIYFCDAITCYSPGTFVSPVSYDIAAGATATPAIVPHMNPGTCTGSYQVRLTLYNVNAVSDSASVLINYTVTTGIEENANLNYKLGNATPNPASENMTVDYTFVSEPKTATIELYNVVGLKVSELKIEGTEGKAKMNVSNLSNGVYFYSLVVDGNKVSTKKVVIAD